MLITCWPGSPAIPSFHFSSTSLEHSFIANRPRSEGKNARREQILLHSWDLNKKSGTDAQTHVTNCSKSKVNPAFFQPFTKTVLRNDSPNHWSLRLLHNSSQNQKPNYREVTTTISSRTNTVCPPGCQTRTDRGHLEKPTWNPAAGEIRNVCPTEARASEGDVHRSKTKYKMHTGCIKILARNAGATTGDDDDDDGRARLRRGL